jgi:hypothetical protein
MSTKRSTVLVVTVLITGIALLLATSGAESKGADGSRLPKPSFDKAGNLIRPDTSYREWVYVGTPLTPNDLNPPEAPFPDFHNVYIHPDDLDHYKRTGKFQDGTVLMKELVSVGSKRAVSGKGYFMGEFMGLEATIKDSKRFPDEPGNWAYFSFGHEYPLADKAEKFPAAACNACHETSAADDFVFTQYYPVLRAAKAGRESGAAMTRDSKKFRAMAGAMAGALDEGMKPTAPTGVAPGAVPTESVALHAYLRAGTYKQMPSKESANHRSAGPHTKYGRPVRVFMNEVLATSLAAGNKQHPKGSECVKEMYTKDGQLEGWAVMVKTQDDSAGGQGWFWYEVTSTKAGSKPFMAGNGVTLCFGCHSSGNDYLLTKWPLR